MREKVYELEINGTPLEATLYEDAMYIKNTGGVTGLMAEINYLHTHSAFELFLILNGKLCVIDKEGRREYSRSAVLIPPNYDHYTESDVSEGYGFYFSFTPDTKSGALSEKLFFEVSALKLTEESEFYVRKLAENVGCQGGDAKNAHLLSLLFLTLFFQENQKTQMTQSLQSKHRKYIFAIDEYLSQNKGRKITLSELAEHLYLCPKQVSRVIKKEYGCTLSELVNRRKLSLACWLLEKTDLKVGEISEMLGFEHENYFFTIFKRAYGYTPLGYRTRLSRSLPEKGKD